MCFQCLRATANVDGDERLGRFALDRASHMDRSDHLGMRASVVGFPLPKSITRSHALPVVSRYTHALEGEAGAAADDPRARDGVEIVVGCVAGDVAAARLATGGRPRAHGVGLDSWHRHLQQAVPTTGIVS